MRWYRLLLPILLLFAQGGMAQTDTLELPFRGLTIEDGLSQGMVNTIVQDRYGFMWFGTKDGLNRYDGYTFTVYRHDAEDTTSLRDNYVHSILEDKQGRLWVGTGKGLDLFDRAHERFGHLRIGEPSTGQAVLTIAQDAHHDLWVSNDNGVIKLTFTGAESTDGLPACTSKYLLDHTCFLSTDRAGSIWVGQLDLGGFRISPDHAGHDRVDTLHLEQPVGDTRAGRSLLDLTSLMVVEDTIHQRLYGMHLFGIVELDARSTRVRKVLDRDPPLGHLRGINATWDTMGRLWTATTKGMYMFDPGSGRLARALPRDRNMTDRTIAGKCAFRDRHGSLWFGTAGYGAISYDPRGERFHNTATESCGPMHAVRNGRVTVASHNTFLMEFDPRNGSWPVRIPWSAKVNHPELRSLSRANRVLVQDERGHYWFNHTGILSYDPVLDVIERHPRDPAAVAAFPEEPYNETLFLEGDSNIWSGTAHTFCRFDRRTGRYHHIPYPRSQPSEAEPFLHTIHRAADGVFWLGTSLGLMRFDRSDRSGPWTAYANDPTDTASLSTDVVYSIQPDPQDADVLWVGTNGGGLNRFDKRAGKVRRYSTKDGLPNDVVYGIQSDDAGHLWMSTNKGISRFHPATGVFRNYDASDGLQGDEFNRYASCRQPDGRLFFGGVKGFNHFNPAELADDSTASAMRITAIKLINKVVDFRSEGSPLTTPAYLSTGMTIPHSANMVTFEFASMEFSAPEEHRYQYKLEGFDPDWIMSGTDRSAVYTNLDPGTYTFRVRGDNRDGVWDRGGASYQLIVLPPWWRTWWAYALYVIALVGGVFVFIRLRTNGLNRQKELLERTVAERTTELSRQKDEADAQRKRAEQSEQVKEQFLANMSHEIRTPMNAIMGMGEVLGRSPHLPEQKPYIDAITSSSEGLLVIVNDILDLSKIEAGRLRLENVRMDPRAVLRQVIETLRFRAEEKGLTVTTDIAPDVPAAVMGDPTRLHQVLLNLVGNAIKFTEQGHVRAAMTAKEQPSGAVMLRCSISDSGIGIAQDRLARVFDEFTQAESDHTRKYGGTGLGLSICKRLIEMQGGTISATSAPGQGSSFSFTIPFAHALVDATTVQPGNRQPGTPAFAGDTDNRAPKLRGLRILLAEDNKMNVMVAKVQLNQAIEGVTIDVAVNGQVTVDMLHANDYDLVLMDVQMPVMNGIEATRIIRALPVGSDRKSRIPIIAMTANVMKKEVDRCMEAGMDGFVPKPFKQEDLLAAIRKVMGGELPLSVVG